MTAPVSAAGPVGPVAKSGPGTRPRPDSTATQQDLERQLAGRAELDDPLQAYINLINWIVTHDSRAQSVDRGFFDLLEKCALEFRGEAMYRNDSRYLKVWIRYAKLLEKPKHVFMYLAKCQIGQELAMFYEEYAGFLEMHNRRYQANEVFKRGLEIQARPMRRLQKNYIEFKHRCMLAPKRKDEPKSPVFHLSRNNAFTEIPQETKPLPRPETRQTTTLPQAKPRRPEIFALRMEYIHRNGEEYCLEEVLAQSRQLYGKKYPKMPNDRGHERYPRVSEPYYTTKVPLKGSPVLSSLSPQKRPSSPTMTVHSKIATDDVNDMFNRPLSQDRSDSSDDDTGFGIESNSDSDSESDNYGIEEDDDDDSDDNTNIENFGNADTDPKTPSNDRINSERRDGYQPRFSAMTPIAETTETLAISTLGKNKNQPRREDFGSSPSQGKAKPSPLAGYMFNGPLYNPIKESLKAEALSRINPPISHYESYFRYAGISLNKLIILQRELPRANVTSKLSSMSIGQLPTLDFTQSDELVCVKREIGRGGYASVYLIESATDGGLAALKVERPASLWEFYILSQIKLRSNKATKNNSVIKYRALHHYDDESYLILDYSSQGTVLDAVNVTKSTGVTSSGGLDECVAIFITVELLRFIEQLHGMNIIHGDLKPDNVMIRFDFVNDNEWSSQYSPRGKNGWSKKGISIIDFGRGIDMNLFSPTVQFTADWKTDTQDCIQMQRGLPWTYEVDYYGVANIIHTMLFGKFIEVSQIADSPMYKLTQPLKRYWQQNLWTNVFDILLNPQSHAKTRLPIDNVIRDCRLKLETWLEENGDTTGVSLKSSLRNIEVELNERRKHLR